MRCPGKVCNACGGNGSVTICTYLVTVFACEHNGSVGDDDKTFSGKNQEALVCNAPGKSFDKSDEGGCNALAWQIKDLPVVCDNGVSCHISHSSTAMVIYSEVNATMRTASGKRYTFEGCGDLPLTVRFCSGNVPVLLRDVAHVPSLSYHLVPLGVVADNEHTYFGIETVKMWSL